MSVQSVLFSLFLINRLWFGSIVAQGQGLLFCSDNRIHVTLWNGGVNITLRIGTVNPVPRDSPPRGCYGDQRISFYYKVL